MGLRARRLKRWQTICRNPRESSTLLATLFGSLVFDPYDNDFSTDCVPENANPWSKQLERGLETLSVVASLLQVVDGRTGRTGLRPMK